MKKIKEVKNKVDTEEKTEKKESFVKIKAGYSFYKANKTVCKLSFYFIFMTIIVIMIRTNIEGYAQYEAENEFINVDALEKLNSNINYDFTQTYFENDIVTTITGNVNEKTVNFVYNDNNYKYINNNFNIIHNNVETVTTNPTVYPFYNLSANNIYDLIKNSTKLSTTTFESGEEVITYNINSEEFYKLYNQYTGENAAGEEILISTTELNNKITTIKIDLTTSASKINSNFYKYIIEIKY